MGRGAYVFFTSNRYFDLSTSNTTSVRADPSVLEDNTTRYYIADLGYYGDAFVPSS